MRRSKIGWPNTPSLVAFLSLATLSLSILAVVPPAVHGDESDDELRQQLGLPPPYFPTDRPPGPLQRGLVTTEEGTRIVMSMKRAVKERPKEKETADLLLHYAFDRKFATSDWIRDEAFRLFPKVDWGARSASVAGKIEKALTLEREPWVQRSEIIALASLGANAKGALPMLGRLQKSGKIPKVRNESTRAVELIRADLERVRLAGKAKSSKVAVEERATREKDADAENRAAARKARQEAGEE